MSPTVHQITPDFFFLQRGWLNGNHFVWRGPRHTLLDSGYLDSLDETLGLLEGVGVLPQDVGLILTTHVHCDHVGGHAFIHQRSFCAIALSEACRRVVDQQDGLAAWWRYYGQSYAWFPTHQTLGDGQFLELADLTWQVLETPGHASGHLCLYAPDTGWLISGDVVWDADFGVLTTRIEGWDAPLRLRDSLLRLSELKVTKVFPGHGPPLEDGPRAVAGCLERAEGFLRHPRRLGQDQVRKILLYHLMMNGPLERGALWELEQGLPWLGEVCQQFFDGQVAATFDRYLDELIERGLVHLEGGLLASTLDA